MVNNPEKQVAGNMISEGFIVAAIPVAAYLFTFNYEKGFADYFGIPNTLIILNWTNLFIVTGIIFGVCMFLLNSIHLIYAFVPKNNKPFYRRIVRLTPLILISLAIFQLYGLFVWHVSLLVPAILIILIFFEFVFPLITQRTVVGYVNKLEAQDTIDDKGETIFDSVFQKVGTTGYYIIMGFLLLWSLSGFAGKAEALKQKDFMVLSNSPEVVILRIYGDTLIGAIFSRETKEVQKKFVIFKISDNSQTKLNLEEVGPLHIQK